MPNSKILPFTYDAAGKIIGVSDVYGNYAPFTSLYDTYTYATLPAASANTGRTAYTSDQGPVYSNGTGWVISAGGSAYYASTNGVTGVNDGSRDDAPLLKAAYLAAIAAGAKSLILPTGVVYLKSYTQDASYPYSYVVRCAANDFSVIVPQGCIVYCTVVDDGQGGTVASKYWSLFQFTGSRSGIKGGGQFIHTVPGYTTTTPNNYAACVHLTSPSVDCFASNLTEDGFVACIGVFDNSSSTGGTLESLRMRTSQYGAVQSATGNVGAIMRNCWATNTNIAFSIAGENVLAGNLKADYQSAVTNGKGFTGLFINGQSRGLSISGIQVVGPYTAAGGGAYSCVGIKVQDSTWVAGLPIEISDYELAGLDNGVVINGAANITIFNNGAFRNISLMFDKGSISGHHSVDTYVNGLIGNTVTYGFTEGGVGPSGVAPTEGLIYLDGGVRITNTSNPYFASFQIVPNGAVYPIVPFANRADVQRVVPTTGSTVTATVGVDKLTLLLVPAATLATLTVVFPTSMLDGQTFRLKSAQIVSTLTVTGTVAGSPSALTAGYDRTFIYDSTAATWL